MKKLTLELYERIIDAVYEKSKEYPDMEIGDGTRHNCAEYIAFYAFHGQLYWSEQGGKIVGVSTAHPGRSDFSWVWPDGNCDGIWTAHLVWADNIRAHAEILQEFLSTQPEPVKQLWTWRNDTLVELTHAKLKRLFSYGKRRINHNSSSSGSSVQRVNEEHSSGTGGYGSTGVCKRGDLPTSLSTATEPAAGCGSSGADRPIQAASA
jgi:hypothetical protein